MKFCKYCGAEIKKGARFCKKCGKSLEEAPYVESSEQRPLITENKKRLGNRVLPVVLTALLIVLLIVVGALLYLKNQSIFVETESVVKREETSNTVSEETDGKDETEETKRETSAVTGKPAGTAYDYTVEAASETKSVEIAEAEAPKVFVGSSSPTNKWNEISVLLDYLNDIQLGNYNRINVPDYAVSESSSIVQEGIDNHAFKAFDGDIKTNWQEGVEGEGIGEYIEVRFPESVPVDMITIAPGNQRTIDWFYKNNIPCNMTIVVNDEYGFPISLPVDIETYAVRFSKSLTVESLKFVINAVYPGTDYDDTVITDIGIYTEMQ